MEDCLSKVKRAIELYERARASPNSITVTRLARKIASPRSHKSRAKAGIKAHNVWGDPLQACTHDEYWTPLPLAYELEGVWIYGVADLVRFRRGQPIEVVELKHYKEPDSYVETQILIYAWLITKLFDAQPRAFIVTGWNGRNYQYMIEASHTLEVLEVILKETLAQNTKPTGRKIRKKLGTFLQDNSEKEFQ